MAEYSSSSNGGMSPLRRFGRLVSTERRDIINIYIFAIFAGLISLSLPLGIQAIFNFVSGGAITTSWVVLVAVVIIGVLGNGLLQIVQIFITERIQQRIFTHSAFEFAYRLPRMRVEALRGQYAPELVNRFFDTLTIQKGFSKILLDFSTSSLQIVFGLILLSFYHPFFILFSLTLLGLLVLVMRVAGPYGLRTSLEESKYKYKVVFWLEEMARAMESFKLAGATRLPLEKTDKMVGNYLDARNKHFKVLVVEYGVILAFKVLIIAAMLIIGSLLVFSNDLNVGQFVAMEIVVILLLNAVEKLILSVENIYDVLTALEKIGSVTDLPLESEKGELVPFAEGPQGLSLSLEGVSLQFPDQRYAVLDKINLKVAAGSRTNIVTTDDSFVAHFFRLLTGFYNGYQGTITFNGLPLQNINLEDLRHHIAGYSTLQEIFEGSLLENITLGIKGVTVERVIGLLKAVGLEEFIGEERLGLDSPLQSGVNGLPEIVRRKIILARTLATHPSLLLLNQPFEGLNFAERQSFIAYLDKHLKGSTVILATFRPEDCQFGQETYIVHQHSPHSSNI